MGHKAVYDLEAACPDWQHVPTVPPTGPNGTLTVTALADEDGEVTMPQLFSNDRVKASDDGPKQRGQSASAGRIKSGDMDTMV